MGKKIFRCGWLGAAGLLLATLSSAGFANTPVIRLTPNSVYDTVQLQAALDARSGATSACLIVLAQGVFHTDVLLVRDFRGRIYGQDAGHTVVRPIIGRALRSIDEVFATDPTLAEPYPVLLHFTDGGDIQLADFTLEFPQDMQVQPYTLAGPPGLTVEDALLSVIIVDGTGTARLLISRLEIIATERPPETSLFGSTLLNAIRFEGQVRFVNDVTTVTPLAGGRFLAHDTHIRRAGLGFALRDSTNVNAQIVNNDVQDVRVAGVNLVDMGNSQVVVADNCISSEVVGVQILRGEQPPEDPSAFNVARNTLAINERGTALFGPKRGGIVVIDSTPEEASIAPS